MKILYHFRTRGSGAEGVHIAGIATAFEKLGYEIVFSSPTGVDPRTSAGSSPYKDAHAGGLLARFSRHCPGFAFEMLELGYNLVSFVRNMRLLRQGGFAFIYERHAYFLFATALLARWFQLPMVVEVNELVGDPRVRAQPILLSVAKWCDRFVFKCASLVVVVSPHLKRRLGALGIEEQKILVLPNAVSAAACATPTDGTQVRYQYGLQGRVVVGFVGWFVEWHRLDRLLTVFAELASTRPALRLLLVGEGSLKTTLEQQARSLGIDVCFTGAIPSGKIPEFIAAMDICVVPHSNDYRSPIKLFEYMAQGRAILAPDLEPIRMALEDQTNALLFPGEDHSALAAKLLQLVEQPQLRERLGQRARSDCLARHTWEQNAARVLQELNFS